MDVKKHIMLTVAVGLVVGAVAFFCGMKFADAKTGEEVGAQRQFKMGGNVTNGGQGQRMIGGRNGGFGGGGFVNGEIIGKDDQSITLKMNDGGSKIVFLSGNTEISKFVAGELTDLETGKIIMVNGNPNQDGSLTAKTIQLRPQIIGTSTTVQR